MKNLMLVSILFCLSSHVFSQTHLPAKYGLIIAVGTYPVLSDWSAISSANDIPLVMNALINQGFLEENITVLKDSAASRRGILNAFEELNKKTKKGDIVVIHYSGHGQQITDDNGDELDGYDEALVPWDAPAFYENKNSYLGENHIRDDEFGQLTDMIRAALGKDGQLLVTIDACHSGTGTRGEVKVRGGKAPFEIPGKKANKTGTEKGSGLKEKKEKIPTENQGKAPYIVITATQFNELDYETVDDEGNPVGPLSYAISRVFGQVSENDSYLSLFSRMATIMSKRVNSQTPTIEGDYHYKLFNGQIIPQQPYFTIAEINSLNRIKLSAGKIHGLNNGDKVGIYKSGTQSTENAPAIANGVIAEAANFSSYVILEKEFNLKYKNNYWVFVKEYGIKSKPLTISINEIIDNALREKVNNSIADYALISIDNKHPELIVLESGSKILIKNRAEGALLKEFSNQAKKEDIGEFLKQYAQSKFIRSLALDDPNYRVELEMIPVKPHFDNYGEAATDASGNFIIKDTLSLESIMENGKIVVGEKDYIMLRILNKGKRDAYFNVIELQPDGVISAVLPQDAMHAGELYIKAGQSIVPRNFIVAGFAPPYGTEMYKVFATPKPINLSAIITSKGTGTKGNLSSVEKIIMGSFGNTKGEETNTVKKEEAGSIFDFTFVIDDKKN